MMKPRYCRLLCAAALLATAASHGVMQMPPCWQMTNTCVPPAEGARHIMAPFRGFQSSFRTLMGHGNASSRILPSAAATLLSVLHSNQILRHRWSQPQEPDNAEARWGLSGVGSVPGVGAERRARLSVTSCVGS